MAVLSTLQIFSNSIDQEAESHSTLLRCRHSSNGIEVLNAHPTLRHSCPSTYANDLGTGPEDGPTQTETWYCPACGDGPYPSWQDSCANTGCWKNKSNAAFQAGLGAVTNPWCATTPAGSNTAPAEGDLVWFCSECSDGPYPTWQVSCMICHHSRCDECVFEELPSK